MWIIVATLSDHRTGVGGGTYFYGPYIDKRQAQSVLDAAEDRKGDRAPAMVIRPLQSTDAFLLGSAGRTYIHASA